MTGGILLQRASENAAINEVNSGRLYVFDFDWAVINNVGTFSVCGLPISMCVK